MAKKESIKYLMTGLLHILESNIHMGLLPITSSYVYKSFTKIYLNFVSMADHCQTYLSFPRESFTLTEFPFTGNTAWNFAESGQDW